MKNEELYKIKNFVSAFTFPLWPIVLKNEIRWMQWGLIPNWYAQQEPLKFAINTLNAKSETLLEKASFKHLVEKRPCLIPSTGFFEYHSKGKEKIPYFIQHLSSSIFSFAGLYDSWTNPITYEKIESFTMITCPANTLMAEIHNEKKRMPVILPMELENEWLATGNQKLLKTLDDGHLKAHQINKKYINTNDPRVQEHYIPPILPSQGTLFEL